MGFYTDVARTIAGVFAYTALTLTIMMALCFFVARYDILRG